MLSKFTLYFPVFFIYGCVTTQRLAREFVENENKPRLLYMSEPQIYLEYHRFQDKTHPIFYYPEKLMHFFSDTEMVALKNAYDSIVVSSLKQMGFEIYAQYEFADFFGGDPSPGWIIQPVQMSFEEYRKQYQDIITFAFEEYLWDTIFSEYQFCVWYEFTPVNQGSDVPVFLLFAATSISDRIDGYFFYDRQARQYVYRYSPELIDKYAFWQFVTLSALTHAQYTFDFFLNKYLYDTRPKSIRKLQYYRWDWERRRLQQAYYRRFIFL